MTGSRAEGEVNVKLGPIVSAFHGILDVARDDARLPRHRARRRPGRQKPVERAGDHRLRRFSRPTAAHIPGRRLGQVPAVRRARAIQPLGPRQGRRRPSDAACSRKISKPGFPAGRLAAESARYARCRRRGAVGDLGRASADFLPQAVWPARTRMQTCLAMLRIEASDMRSRVLEKSQRPQLYFDSTPSALPTTETRHVRQQAL